MHLPVGNIKHKNST